MSYKFALPIALTVICAPFSAMQALAETAPNQQRFEAGFDCAKAQSAVEKAICSNEEIAAADRAMSIAYNAVMAESKDPAFTAAMRLDQQNFIATREQSFGLATTPQEALDRLSGATEARAEMLNWWLPNTHSDLVGKWSNLSGTLHIRRASNGVLSIEAEAVDQLNARWVCGFDGDLVEESDGTLRGWTLGGDLVLRRNGGVLEVPVPFCDETGPSPFGSFQGSYFRIGAPEEAPE